MDREAANAAVEALVSYSHRDERARQQLETHLSLLQRQKLLSVWHDRKIGAGTEWKGQIDTHLDSAELILLLVSPDFLASDYCYDVELAHALKGHEAGEARVIPIILRPVDWHEAPFGKLQALPREAKPISTWSNRDEAFRNVVEGIRRTVRELRASKTAPVVNAGSEEGKVPPHESGREARPWLDPAGGSETPLPLHKNERAGSDQQEEEIQDASRIINLRVTALGHDNATVVWRTTEPLEARLALFRAQGIIPEQRIYRVRSPGPERGDPASGLQSFTFRGLRRGTKYRIEVQSDGDYDFQQVFVNTHGA